MEEEEDEAVEAQEEADEEEVYVSVGWEALECEA